MKRIIGIPSNGPELFDDISAHFGHCEYFVGIEVIDKNSFKRVFSLRNEGHSGCMEPVMNMRERNVTDMIVGGIGGRPFVGFQQIGINLYQGGKGFHAAANAVKEDGIIIGVGPCPDGVGNQPYEDIMSETIGKSFALGRDCVMDDYCNVDKFLIGY